MNYLILLGIVLFSTLIAFQDFTTRSVSILYLIGFTLVVFFQGFMQFQLQQTFVYFLYNLCFLAFQTSVLVLYYFIKYKNFKLLFSSLGAADVWVLLALAFAFDLPTFIIFICISFISALVYYSVISFVLRKQIKEIPLAGIVVVCYVFRVFAF